MALSDIVPINRKEEFLQAIADKSGAPSPVTRIEEFLKRISESSGGSSLPEYTSADKGKALTLGDGSESETVVIVPEQTVTLVGASPDPVPLLNTDFSGVSVGTPCVLTVGENSENLTFESEDGMLFVIGELGAVTYSAETGALFGTSAGTYTVSLTASVPSVKPKWETVSGALIVKATGEARYGAEDGFIVNADVTPAKIQACFQPDTARPVYILFPQFSYDGTVASYDYSDPLSNFMMPLRQLMASEEVTYSNYKYTFVSLGTSYFLAMIEENT